MLHRCLHLNLAAPSMTDRLAARIASAARPGDTILLSGPFGAGKTAFARAFLRALTDEPALEVPSPSYSLVQSYETKLGTVQHFDLWRIDPAQGAQGAQGLGARELAELGWPLAAGDLALIEWPDRLGQLAPPDALRIDLAHAGPDRRAARLCGWPDRLERFA